MIGKLTNGMLGFFFGFFLVLGTLTVGLIRVRVGGWCGKGRVNGKVGVNGLYDSLTLLCHQVVRAQPLVSSLLKILYG